MKFLTFGFTLFMAIASAQAAEQATQQTIAIPHDPAASHALVEKSGTARQRMVVTRREGLLGVMYSRHLYNCERHTVALLATGHSLENLDNTHPGRMLPVVESSTAYYIEAEACS